MSKVTRIIIVIFVVGGMALAQTAEQNPQRSSMPSATNSEPSAPAVQPDPAKQMQLDLDQMDSLVNNMAAQVSFIRDTNMSILLNTNVRLWSVLIRDLRLQLQQQQKGMATGKPSSSETH